MRENETGSMNSLFFPMIGVSVGLVFALVLGIWAFVQMQDYKNNSDAKSSAASKVAVDLAVTQKDNEFLEKEKNPLRSYKGEAVLGAISFDYPKTWSGYQTSSGSDLKLIMQPGLVKGNEKTTYSLKVEVVAGSYDSFVKQFESQIKAGKLTAKAVKLDKVPTALGTRLDGEITVGVKGSMVILPLRDKTIKISTESEEFLNDFNTIILPSFAFLP